MKIGPDGSIMLAEGQDDAIFGLAVEAVEAIDQGRIGWSGIPMIGIAREFEPVIETSRAIGMVGYLGEMAAKPENAHHQRAAGALQELAKAHEPLLNDGVVTPLT